MSSGAASVLTVLLVSQLFKRFVLLSFISILVAEQANGSFQLLADF